MSDHGIHIKELPQLKNPLLIAGFDGWGNALNISNGMAGYLIRRMNVRYQLTNQRFIHERGIQMVEQIRTQLKEICQQNELDIESCAANKDLVRYGMSLLI